MQKTIKIAALLLIIFTGNCFSQTSHVVNHGVPVTVQNGITITFQGNFTNENLGTFTNDGLITLPGNWINNTANAVFTTNTGEVAFLGTAAQSIGGTNSTGFSSLTINNTSGTGVTLNNSTNVNGTLTLTNGVVFCSSGNILTMNAGSTATSGSASSFVDGPMNKIGTTAFVFPVGNVAKWARIGITAPATAGTTFQAQYFTTPYTNTTTMAAAPTPVLKRVSVKEYWTLNRTVNTDNVQVTLYWESATFSGINNCGATTPLRIAHWNGSAWENNNNAVTTTGTCGTAGTLSTNLVVTSFSPFTFGSDTTTSSVDPLPIELLSFNATPNGKAVDLAWTTASEINNDFFTIERTTDGFNFEMIGTLKGAGNSTWVINYTLVDNHPSDGVSYYRLKQTDYDGHTSYSELKMVSFEKNTDFSFNIFPNPTDDGIFNVEINAAKNAEVLVVVHDVLGKEIYSKVIITEQKGNIVYAIDLLQKVSPGVYLITVTSNDKIYNKKLIVNE